MRCLLAILLACAATAAAAGEFFGTTAINPVPVGAGARAMGLGGAFAAIADDATANTHNPAGMAQLDLPEVALSGGVYHDRLRLDNGEDEEQTAFALDHVSAIWPFFAGVQQTVGLSWQRQYDFTRAFTVRASSVFVDDSDPGNPETFSTETSDRVDQRGAFSSFGLSWAMEIGTVAFGVTGRVWNDALSGASHYREDRFVVSTNVLSDVDNGVIDVDTDTIDLHTLVSVEEGYSAELGVLWRALPALNLALTVKPRYRLRLREETSASTNGGAAVAAAPARADYDYPTSAVIAAAWRLGDLRTLSLDVGWTRWSELALTSNGSQASPVSNFVDTADHEDGFSVRVGGEQLFILARSVLAARVGAFYEGLPGLTRVGDATQAADTRATTDHYFGLAAGVGLGFRHLVVDAAAQWRFANDIGAGTFAAPDRSADIDSLSARLGVAWQW